MRICCIFLPAVFAAGLLAVCPASADNAPPAAASAGGVKFAAAAKAAAAKRDTAKAGPRMGKKPPAAGPRIAAAAKAGDFTLPPDESKTSLDISFGDDDAGDRPDGGIDKLTSPAVVGVEHKFGDNMSIGGGALFDGRGRGAAAQLGFSW